MGLFSKKKACPACGEEVKGLFLIKIGDKKALCKNCSRQVSMNKVLLKTASPEFIKEHLDYRRKNAEKYAACQWTVKITSIPGFQFGLDEVERAIYLIHHDLHDDKENPVVFSFDQLTGYELFRRKKKLDGMEDTGMLVLETGLSVLGGIARLVSNDKTENVDRFHLKLTTTDPYWEDIDIKIDFTENQLYGFGEGAKNMQQLCQLLKNIIRREPLCYTS